jgi:hypothetical protein
LGVSGARSVTGALGVSGARSVAGAGEAGGVIVSKYRLIASWYPGGTSSATIASLTPSFSDFTVWL